MPTPPLIARVRELEAELGETQPHPEAAAEVDEIRKQVSTVLLEPEHAPHYASLRDRLQASRVALALHHPKLAALLESVSNALNAAGI